MGKVRAKKRAALGRAQAADFPSPEELKGDDTEEVATPSSEPILQRLSNPDPSERQWACQSLSHLLLDYTHVEVLMEGRVVRRLTPLLLDSVMEIREAAAGALRNMSSSHEPRVHEHIAREDIMTPVAALVRDIMGRLDVAMETERIKMEKMMADRAILLRIVEEVLCLLWNMSERSSMVVEVLNREGLLPWILQMLQPTTHPLSLCLAAAQLLHVVTEDNQDAIRLVSSSSSHLAHLESVLAHPFPDNPCGRGQILVIRAAVAGVFQNLLPSLPDAICEATLQGVLSTLGGILEAGYQDNPSSESELEAARLVLSAKELACEVLANVCYTEGDAVDDDEWEDCDSVEGVEGVDVMEEQQSCDLPSLRLIVEAGLHNRVMVLYQCTCSVFTTAPEPLKQRLTSLLSAILLNLQNLISSLPPESWEGQLPSLWTSLFSPPPGYVDQTFPALGVLITLVERLGSCEFVTEDQLAKLCELGGCASEVGVRADVMRLMGAIAALALKDTSTTQPLLNVIGTALRDSVQKDTSLWVVCQALDSIFDMFGSDSCPPDLFTSLSLLPILRQTAATITARLRVEKKSLGSQLPLIKSAKVNLPRFIDYMTSKR